MELVDSIIAYECGELNNAETLNLFSELVKSGMAWKLQGCYGGTASRLIEAGYIDKDGNILK